MYVFTRKATNINQENLVNICCIWDWLIAWKNYVVSRSKYFTKVHQYLKYTKCISIQKCGSDGIMTFWVPLEREGREINISLL